MLRKRTIWAIDLEQFDGEDAMRWCFGGGKSAPPPPPPAPEPRDDRREIPGKHFVQRAFEQTGQQAIDQFTASVKAGIDREFGG